MEADSIVYGGDLMFFIGSGTTKLPLAWSTSAKLSTSVEIKKVSSKDHVGKSVTKTTGTFDWNGSTDCLLSFDNLSGTTYLKQVYTMYKTGIPINIIFSAKTGNTQAWTSDQTKPTFIGQAIISTMDITAGDGEQATYTVSFEGSGDLILV